MVKIRVVSSYSIRRPGSPVFSMEKNAVRSDTRAACCMLCVTMMIVYWFFSSLIRSSIASVEIGSSAEHGSSIRTTCGSTAIARAMHSRCCCPPDSPAPGRDSRVCTSFHRLAARNAFSHASSRVDRRRTPLSLSPATTLS